MNDHLSTARLSYEKLRVEHQLLPVKVSPFYRSLIDEESSVLGPGLGPLVKAMLPTESKVIEKGPGEQPDFIDDRSQMPVESRGRWLHKYADRVLFMPTFRCLSNCMYCFRQDILGEGGEAQQLEQTLDALIEYLNRHEEVRELILSGGDPLMVPVEHLEMIFSKVSEQTMIRRFRIHTRAPVFEPKVLNDGFLNVLAKFGVRTFLHLVHPYEITPQLLARITKGHSMGVKFYNHFPLLRQVNDHADVLMRTIERLDEVGVRTVSIYFPEPVMFSATYRIPFRRIQKLVRSVQHRSPSWLHSVRFCQDTNLGKCQLHEFDRVDAERGLVIYEREGKRIEVPDFPESQDQPGERSIMLWKG